MEEKRKSTAGSLRKKRLWKLCFIILTLIMAMIVLWIANRYVSDKNNNQVKSVEIEVLDRDFMKNDNYTEDSEGNGYLDSITPGESYSKSPQALNKSTKSAYVFLSVEVPYGTFSNEDKKSFKQLFTWKADGIRKSSDGNGNTINKGWELVAVYDVQENDMELLDNNLTSACSHDQGSFLYVYAYVPDGRLSALGAGEESVSLFDQILFVDAEKAELEEYKLTVTVRGYGVMENGKTIVPGNTLLQNWELLQQNLEI